MSEDLSRSIENIRRNKERVAGENYVRGFTEGSESILTLINNQKEPYLNKILKGEKLTELENITLETLEDLSEHVYTQNSKKEKELNAHLEEILDDEDSEEDPEEDFPIITKGEIRKYYEQHFLRDIDRSIVDLSLMKENNLKLFPPNRKEIDSRIEVLYEVKNLYRRNPDYTIFLDLLDIEYQRESLQGNISKQRTYLWVKILLLRLGEVNYLTVKDL